jgi:hypothetical protein
MAPTEPVIAAPNGPTQRQYVTSEQASTNNIFDALYDEDDDDKSTLD